MEKSFLAFVEQSIKQNWDLDALTDYKGATLQYKDLARKIEKLHILLEESGVQPGDKVAICGRNSSHWGVAFLATLTYGAIAVPILHEFKADTIHNIVNHSDARLLFVGDMAWESLNEAEMPALEGIILMTDFTLLVCRSKQLEYAREHLNEMFGRKFPRNFRREHVSYRRDDPEELAIINYTSGTTSFSKGVSCSPTVHYGRTLNSLSKCSRSNRATGSYPCFPWHTCTGLLSSFCTKSVADAMSISSPVCQVRRLSLRHLPM